jgi:hypothetical protein
MVVDVAVAVAAVVAAVVVVGSYHPVYVLVCE